LIVKSGGVIVFPTDTIYGIGCDPRNDAAVGRIFAIKGRDEKKPLPVLVGGVDAAEKLVNLGRTGRALAKKFWPGALTIVAPIIDTEISARVTAGRSSLAVRMPANQCILDLLAQCECLVGTSANLSGKASSRTVQQVIDSGLQGYDALLASSDALMGTESTIIDISGSKPTIARHGAIDPVKVMEFLAHERF
jgi:L-threonylcarbamoyladenylate synthase